MNRPRFEDHWRHVNAIIRGVLDACEPAACVRRSLGEHPCEFRKPAVLAMGKAAAGMFKGWTGPRPSEAIVVVPRGTRGAPGALRGEHPLPGEGSLRAGAAVERLVRECSASGDVDGLVVLLSGGASSLAVMPIEPLTLEDYRRVVQDLLRAGASIQELNTVRRHIDRLKGGRLAALAHPLPVDVRVISDVIGDDPAAIASGPFSPDVSSSEDAIRVLARRSVQNEAVARALNRPESESLKPGHPGLGGVRYRVAASNAMALRAAEEVACRMGFDSVRATPGLVGEAAEAGGRVARDALGAPRPSARIWGGETTVRVGAAGGVGGRNQEMALRAAIEVAGRPGLALMFFATDGVDGPTTAAGAVITGETTATARLQGLDPAGALASHDSNGFFEEIGRRGHRCLLTPGPTGTNVNDVAVALCY